MEDACPDRCQSGGRSIASLPMIWGLVGTMATACGDSAFEQGVDGSSADDPYAIGVVTPISGPVAVHNVEHEADIQLALHEINGAGGVLGRPLSLAIHDSRGDPATAAAGAAQLIEELEPAVLFGALLSSSTARMLDVTVPAGVLLVNGASSSGGLTARDNAGLFVRTRLNGSGSPLLMARLARDHGHRHVGVLSSESNFQIAKAKTFVEAFNALDCGGQPCRASLRTFPADQDPLTAGYTQTIAEIISEGADGIYLAAYAAHGVEYLRAGSLLNYRGPWFVTVPLRDKAVLEQLDVQTQSQMQGIFWKERIGTHSYELYRALSLAHFGSQTESDGASYDAFILLALAAEAHGAWEAQGMAQAIREVSRPPGEKVYPGEFARALALLAEGQAIDYDGAGGDVSLNDRGDVSGSTAVHWHVVNGEFGVLGEYEVPLLRSESLE